MTDLSGAELDLAVAKAMGLRVIDGPWEVEDGPPNLFLVAVPSGVPRYFSPTSGGADAWEVLAWAVEHNVAVYLNRLDIDVGYWQEPSRPSVSRDVLGVGSEHIAIALCRAVVALGGEE